MAATRESFLLNSRKPKGVFISFRGMKFGLLGIVLLMAAGFAFNFLRGTPLQRGNSALIKAFANRRLIEPRLSGGFKAAVFNPSKNDETGINKSNLDQATILIQDAVNKNDPSTQLSYGRLLVSKGTRNSDALKHLRLAVKNLPASAEAYNDLGVCLMERGKLEEAIDKFNLALKEKADMPEALFNRAVCYQRLLLRDAASKDFERLLATEPDNGWKDEIARRQKEMSADITAEKQEKDIVAAFRAVLNEGNVDEAKSFASRNLAYLLKHVYQTCALEFLNAAAAGKQEEADKALYEIELIGGQLVATNGDRSITDFANYLRNLPSGERQTEIRLVKEYLAAEESLKPQKVSEAQPVFFRLMNQFAERGNTLFQFYASQRNATGHYLRGEYAKSSEETKQTLAFAEKQGWPYRQSLALYQLGTINTRIGQDSLALKNCEQASKLARGIPVSEAIDLGVMASAYSNLGDLDNGLSCLRESTRLYLMHAPKYQSLASNYQSIAEYYNLIGNHSLALLYAKQALAFSQTKKITKGLAQATVFIALELAYLGQFDEAEQELRRAFDYLEEIEEGQREYTRGFMLTAAGELYAEKGDIARALDYYSKAEETINKSQENIIPLMKVLHARARAYLRANDFVKARADLQRAVTMIEDYRAHIESRKNRSDFLDASQDIFDEMIPLNIRAFADWTEAFNLSEQSRARTLLDDLSPDESASLPRQQPTPIRRAPVGKSIDSKSIDRPIERLGLSQLQAALPDDLRLITYSVTKHGTFIFLVTNSALEHAESPVTTETLNESVQDYMSSLKSRAPIEEVSEKSRVLYSQLIEPIESHLGDGKRLCIVPDKMLHFLPFAALLDSSGKYLFQSHRLIYAPSASVLIRCLREALKKGPPDNEKMLAVGNPKFNEDEFPTLAKLPEAEREAKDSAAFYNSESLVLNGPKATKANVKAALSDCDVLHLSSHCLVEEKSPWLAAVVLAAEGSESAGQHPSGDGLLYLNEIYGMTLPRTKLVVLSACQSGLGQYYRGEGIVSLVRPFLALKVPTVVASLWSVDSQASAELMIDFHRQRKNRLGTGDALRAAQFKMANSASYRHPYYWAPFISVGSSN